LPVTIARANATPRSSASASSCARRVATVATSASSGWTNTFRGITS
jgi:hypothetical protein